MKLNHIVEAQQFSRDWMEKELFPLVKDMEGIIRHGGSGALHGKRMITFFYEPSTRTRASFEIAMDNLGGRVVFSTENATQFSSVSKGETLKDTIEVLNRYHPDVIVLRHSEEGAAQAASEISKVPIINAGDGTGQHPTQALLDCYTIQKRFGNIDGLSVAIVGDLARGRTVRSLCYLLGKFKNITIHFVAPEVFKMRDDIKAYLKRHGVKCHETTDLRTVAKEVDVIYQTRIQKERGNVIFDNGDGNHGFFNINGELANSMKKDAIIMHPLPRVDEITIDVDDNPRAVYLKDQVESGLSVRMALLKMLLKP